MEKLEINTSTLKSDADKIQELAESIPALINELESSVNKFNSCWEGAAWGTYNYYLAHNIDQLNEIYNEMSGYTTNMHEAAKKYARTEQDILSKLD